MKRNKDKDESMRAKCAADLWSVMYFNNIKHFECELLLSIPWNLTVPFSMSVGDVHVHRIPRPYKQFLYCVCFLKAFFVLQRILALMSSRIFMIN